MAPLLTSRRADVVSPWSLIACALGVIGLVWSIRFAFAHMQATDFEAFYRSGRASLDGTPLYAGRVDRPNLNPPLVVALLFAPLSTLPLRTALMVWMALGMLAVAWTLAALARVVPPPRLLWAGAGLGASLPAMVVWMEGQITWLLLPLCTAAWLAHRRGSASAGWWLAPLVAIKPPLALCALLLPVPIWTRAAIGSMLLTLGGIGLTGWHPWAEWIQLGRQITWIGDPINASLWGIAARVPAAARWIVALAGSGVLLACLPVILRADPDRRWLLAVLWTTLAVPLGWIYYLPLAVGPLLVTGSRTVAILCALYALPGPLFGPVYGPSLYGVLTVIALVTIAWQGR